jgi:hypothetical protein
VKKLELGALRVEAFATAAVPAAVRGTVVARDAAIDTTLHCPVSYGGTCYITCGADCTQAACA